MTIKLKPFNLNPPKHSREEELLNFLKEADDPKKSGSFSINKTEKEDLPWDKPHVRQDLKKIFNIRLSEKDYIKLEYLAQMKKESMHKICIDILIPQLNKMLDIN